MITMLGGMRAAGAVRANATHITVGMDSFVDHVLAIFQADVPPEEAATALESLILYRSIIQYVTAEEFAGASLESIIAHIQTVLGPGGLDQASSVSIESIVSHIKTAFGPGVLDQSAGAAINSIILYEAI